MTPLHRHLRLLAPLLAVVSVLTAGLLSAPPASAAMVTSAPSAPTTCSSPFAAVVVALQPENRVKGIFPAGTPRTGSSASVLPNSVRGFDLFLRLSTSGVTVYVNGDPVNLVDPSGHAACEGNSAGSCMSPGRNARYSSTQMSTADRAVNAENKSITDDQKEIAAAWSNYVHELATLCGASVGDLSAAQIESCLYGDRAPQLYLAGGATLVLPGAAAVGGSAAADVSALGLADFAPPAAVIAALWPHDAGQSDADEMAEIHRYALQSFVAANLGDLEGAISQARGGKDLTVDQLIWNLQHMGMPEFGVFPPPNNWKPPGGTRVGFVVVGSIITGLGGSSFYGKDSDANDQPNAPPSPAPAPKACPTPPPGSTGSC